MNHKRYNYTVILKTEKYIVIEDMCNSMGGMSITNVAEEVVQEVLSNQVLMYKNPNKRIFYIDTDGCESELIHNGKYFEGFSEQTHMDVI